MRGGSPDVGLDQLWQFLDESGKDYFTAPHHTGRAGKYRSFADPDYDPEREAVFEIYSMWGSSECRWNRFPIRHGNAEEPAYFRDALRAGCRYGVIASSDDHQTLPGGQGKLCQAGGRYELSTYIHHGLAAVRASKLSRGALWDAIQRRDCYGTTFARSLIDMEIDGIPMGSAAEVSSKQSLWDGREIEVSVLPDGEPPTITLIRNDEEICHATWDPEQATVTFQDDEPLSEIAVRDARFHPEPFVAYYVRVEDNNHQTQWSSPIWLDLR